MIMKLTTQTKLHKLKSKRDCERELLWELKLSYRLALACTMFSVLLIFGGIIYGLLGQISIGLLSTIIGLLINRVSKIWIEFWREARQGIDDPLSF
jgi:hypothetical protein